MFSNQFTLLSPVAILSIALMVLATFEWIVVAWLRLYRLIHYFQRCGFNSKRFLRWLLANEHEMAYGGIFLSSSLLTIPCLICGPFVLQSFSNSFIPFEVVLAAMNVFFASAAIKFRRRGQQGGHTFSYREVKLLAIASIALVLPAIAAWIYFFSVPRIYDLDGEMYMAAVSATIASAITFFAAPFVLPIANVFLLGVERLRSHRSA